MVVSVGLIALVLSVSGVAHSLRGVEPDATLATFSTGGIDLKIDSRAWYNGVSVPSATWALKNLTPGTDKFFNFDDVKPGDFGCNVISMHVKNGDAWLCLDFKNLKNLENGINEPEGIVDSNGTTTGELAAGLQFFGWLDNGDGKYKSGEKPLFGTSTRSGSVILNNTTYSIGDSKSGRSCKKDESRYVAMCWCAGNLSVDMNTGKMSCDGSGLGNALQTDTVTVDVAIRALSSTGDPKFLCNPTRPQKPQYCSHGYWKQSQHYDNWVNYAPTQQFSSVFENAFPGKTLLQVLQNGGGGLNQLGRETVGALLNAGKLSNFPYTQAQVIAMFNAAYPGTQSSYNAHTAKFTIPENCPLK
jgi:hypothetical protein